MGVPAFFRWLSRQYPSVIIECIENKQVDEETGQNIYEDSTMPNPNGVEFDNLYLDMNGIIHPCTHPEDKPAPKNEDEMMIAIFESIDRLFAIVRPRKLLYMAIDGVAPRAKMNQQRSRRFRAAKEAVEKRLEIERIREELLVRGCKLPPQKENGEHFDSNCITPGTPFMDRLSKCLHYYVHDRLNNNPGWKGIKVILSDANVPGEGEHKIMDYIRKQRAQLDHDPNTQHVLCGADADLIMLGLATHEPNFTIIREEFLPNKPRPCDICNQFGHEMDKCIGLNPSEPLGSNFKPDVPIGAEVKFIFVRLSVLREYLRQTLEMPNLPFRYDFERALDDWVFMCFFVGNDFLPHLPSLEIREGAIDRLVELYKKCVYKTSGYLTKSGDVNLDRVQLIMTDLGNMEDQIFKDRQKQEQIFKARAKKRKREEAMQFAAINASVFGPQAVGPNKEQPQQITNYKQEAASLRNRGADGPRGTKRTSDEFKLDDEEEEEDNDEVRLWEDGFKDRYYESKFDVTESNLGFRYSVALQYVRGLCWVLKYYYQGCASWSWYFPYHYAPFASDFVNIHGLDTQFQKGSAPLKPLEQLMGVFPAASSSHVPLPWAQLMSDPESVIIDFYPEDFKIDLNGKKFAWQGVALLPFVEESRLFKALSPYYEMLTEEEVRRNQKGDSRLYVAKEHPQYETLAVMYDSQKFKTGDMYILMDGMRGTIYKADDNVDINGFLSSPISELSDVKNNQAITVRYRDPEYDDDFIFKAVRLEKAVDPPKILPSKSNQRHNLRPAIGFNQNLPKAYITGGGHRMLNASIRGGGNAPQRGGHGGNNFSYNYNQQGSSASYRGGGGNFGRGFHNNYNNYDNNRQNNYNNNRHNASGNQDYSNRNHASGNQDYNNRHNASGNQDYNNRRTNYNNDRQMGSGNPDSRNTRGGVGYGRGQNYGNHRRFNN